MSVAALFASASALRPFFGAVLLLLLLFLLHCPRMLRVFEQFFPSRLSLAGQFRPENRCLNASPLVASK